MIRIILFIFILLNCYGGETMPDYKRIIQRTTNSNRIEDNSIDLETNELAIVEDTEDVIYKNKKGEYISISKDKYTVNTIEDLKKSSKYKAKDIIHILGYYEAGDKGEHKRKIEATQRSGGVQLVNNLWANPISDNGIINARALGFTTTMTESELLSIINDFDGIYFEDVDLVLNKEITINKNIVLISNGSKLDLKFVPTNFAINSDYEIILSGFKMEYGSQHLHKVLKTTTISKQADVMANKQYQFVKGGMDFTKMQDGTSLNDFSPSALMIHNYTDAPTYRVDSVGASPMFYGVASRNTTRRWDKPNDYVGTGDFLRLSEHFLDTDGVWRIRRLYSIDSKGTEIRYDNNKKIFKANNVAWYLDEKNGLQKAFFSWDRSNGVNTITTVDEIYNIGNDLTGFNIKNRSFNFSDNGSLGLNGTQNITFKPTTTTKINTLFMKSNGNLIFRDNFGVEHTLVDTGRIYISQFDTPYYTLKMKQEGVYEYFIEYMDRKIEYDRLQRELKTKRQLAFKQRENQEQSYEEWLAEQPIILIAEEPQLDEKLLKFVNKYAY